MKLTKRLVEMILLSVALVLAGECAVQIAREISLFRNDVEHDHRLIGHILENAVRDAWADGGDSAAERLVEETSKDQHVTIRWRRASETSGDDIEFEAIALHDWLSLLIPRAPQGVFRTTVPVRLGLQKIGALELTEPLGETAAYLRRTVLSTALTTCLVLLASIILTVVFGLAYVARPTGMIIDKARKIGRGDFGGTLKMIRDDEFGELARELNTTSEMLAEAQRRVEEESAARIRALEGLRHAERLATVGQLAAGVAHELGTPLNVVSARAEMIASGETEAPRASQEAQIIIEQTDRMAVIVRQLLDFARRRPPKKASEDLVRVVHKTIAVLGPLADRRGIVLLAAGRETPLLEVDASQIEQVLTNLVMNAIHATPRGGQVTVELERTAEPRASINVHVRDTGCGIPVEHRKRLFEPFFTTKPVGEGTGLGLSVAYGIVSEHGGWITVDSEVGRGSVFTIHLPSSSGESGARRSA